MIRFEFRALIAAALASIATLTSSAAPHDDQLKIGSAPPPITVDWVQGNVSDVTTAGKTYVVEFWATWCGPCMRSIPHLNELHSKYKSKGLVIMGISDEDMGTVKPFVTKKSSAMSYPVGVDRDRGMKQAWMEAAKQNGIPCAFIVRDSKIVWIGNPLDPNFDNVLLGTMSGRYNPALTKKAEPILRAAKDAVRIKNFQDAYKHYDSVLAIDPVVFGNVAVMKYKTMVVDAKDPVAARKWMYQFMTLQRRDGTTMREIAETVLNDNQITERDLELARDAALYLNNFNSSPAASALLAEVYYRRGQLEKASEFQLQAWMSADADEKADFKRALDLYKKAIASKAAAASK